MLRSSIAGGSRLCRVVLLLSAVGFPLSAFATDWPTVQESRWDRAEVRKEKIHFVNAIAAQIRHSQERYDSVALRVHVPWDVIAALHNMECGLSFWQNLCNGDPLTARTRHVPAGRPPTGRPPFSWESAAIDALEFDHLNRAYWNSRGWILQNIERYNGTGYQRFHPGVPSPYLWAGTNIYVRGKYIEDGKWSSTAISQQIGVVPILKTLP